MNEKQKFAENTPEQKIEKTQNALKEANLKATQAQKELSDNKAAMTLDIAK